MSGAGVTPVADRVVAAQRGDREALASLIEDHLDMLYNVAGRALNGHADVDDVVQETCLRVVESLPDIREPARFSGWILAIVRRQIVEGARRRRTSTERHSSLELATELPDPGADFADATVLRLRLSGQRRQVVEAVRWLDPDDRFLLSLWWLEVADHITRTDLATALGVPPGHAAVRIKRMRDQLDLARSIVGALDAQPRCPELAAQVYIWDGRPSPVWRKRLARHVRDCAACETHKRRLVPPDALLAGIAMLPLPPSLAAISFSALVAAPVAGAAAGAAGLSIAGWLPALGISKFAAAAGAVAVAVGGGVTIAVQDSGTGSGRPAAVAPATTPPAPAPEQTAERGGAVPAPGTPPAAFAASGGYAFAYFTETPNQSGASYGLHLAVSSDGLNWRPLNQNSPVVMPTAGDRGLRDPFILRKQDGTFVVLAADLKGTDFRRTSQYLHVWDSKDLRSFTGYRRIRMHDRDTHTWAPTAFWVASRQEYAIVYSANDGKDVLLANYTKDFRSVSAAEVYFSPEFGVLDADIVADNSAYYMYYKNVDDGLLYGARSATGAPNSWTTYTAGLRQGTAIAGPMVVKNRGGGGWRLWGDSFGPVNNDFYAWSTSDITAGRWTLLSQREFTPPLNGKQGSIVEISPAELDGLVSAWGLPESVRLKSYNFPDRYVRHAANVGRIDAFPFDPHQDQLWRLVPGLADPAGVSFESINFPGRYLRHRDFAIRLDADDRSPTFRADATFYRTPGLADPAWSSFRSYNAPDRYLRHSKFLLRIDPISAGSRATDRQDATFRIS